AAGALDVAAKRDARIGRAIVNGVAETADLASIRAGEIDRATEGGEGEGRAKAGGLGDGGEGVGGDDEAARDRELLTIRVVVAEEPAADVDRRVGGVLELDPVGVAGGSGGKNFADDDGVVVQSDVRGAGVAILTLATPPAVL